MYQQKPRAFRRAKTASSSAQGAGSSAAPAPEAGRVLHSFAHLPLTAMQREEDKGSWFDRGVNWLEAKEHNAVQWAAKKAEGVPVLGTAVSAAAHNIDAQTQLVGGAAKGAGHLAGRVASGVGYVRDKVDSGVSWAENKVDHGVNWAEAKEHDAAQWAAKKAEGVPVLGTAASLAAQGLDAQTQFTGGIVKGAGGLVGGVAHAGLHPLNTAAGLEAVTEHIPIAGDPLKAAHGLVNVALGQETLEQVSARLDPVQSLKDDAQFGGNMVKGIVAPYRQAIKDGKPMEAVGRGVFDVLSTVGTGGFGAAAEGVADGARVAKIAGEVGTGGEIAATIGKGVEAGSDAAKVTEAVAPAAVDAVAPAAVDAVAPAAVDAASGARQFGHSWFGKHLMDPIREGGTLGREGNPSFFTPLEDVGDIRSVDDAARSTGMAPSLQDELVGREGLPGKGPDYRVGDDPAHGVSFPTDGLDMRLPTAADAGPNPNFLPGGETAVALAGPEGKQGMLMTGTPERVTPGGGPMPEGSVIHRTTPEGAWEPLWKMGPDGKYVPYWK